MKWFATLLGLLALNLLSAQNPWELKKEKNGIAVYTQESLDSPLDAFKGVTEVEASIQDIVALFVAADQMVHWVPDCKTSELLQYNGQEQIHYVAYEAPWPATDRDSYVKYSYDWSDAKKVVINFEALPNFKPEKDGFVRVPKMSGFWQLHHISDTKTQIIYQVKADAGGAIPKWLANAGAVNTPYNKLNNLRLYLAQ